MSETIRYPGRRRPLTFAERIMQRIAVDGNGCWIWQLNTSSSYGYGRVAVDGVVWRVHRYVYEELVGPIPDGLELDHLCRVRACCNPEHLEPVSHATNCDRSPIVGFRGKNHNTLKTHCPQGHPYDEANTYYGSGKSGRRCRACRRQRDRQRTAHQ